MIIEASFLAGPGIFWRESSNIITDKPHFRSIGVGHKTFDPQFEAPGKHYTILNAFQGCKPTSRLFLQHLEVDYNCKYVL